MPSRKIELLNNNFYHVYNRTVKSRQLFYTHKDYLDYLKLWDEIDFSKCARIFAFCLMPNHYHYLILVTDETLFPKKISYFFNKYLKRLNALRKESGIFFKDRYKVRVVTEYKYLISLCGYLHLNPVKADLVELPENWEFSNYLEFIGNRNRYAFDRELFSEFVKSTDHYLEFLKTRYSQNNLGNFLFEEND